MKRSLITLLFLVAFIGVAPIVAAAPADLQDAQIGIDGVHRLREDLAATSRGMMLTQKDLDAANLATQQAIKERDEARSGTTKFEAGVLIIIGSGILVAGGLIGWVTGQYALMGFSVAACLTLYALGAGIARYPDQWSLYGLIGGGVLTFGFAIYCVVSIAKHRDAGVENGNLIPLAKATGKFTADQIATLEQLAYTEGSALADKLRAAAEGVSVKSVISRAKAIIKGKTATPPPAAT